MSATVDPGDVAAPPRIARKRRATGGFWRRVGRHVLRDKVALVCDGRRATYREVETEANQLEHGLIARGVERGDRVVIFLDNSVEAAVAIWAVLKAGAVFVMANPTTKPDKLTFILNNSRAAAIISHAKREWLNPGPNY